MSQANAEQAAANTEVTLGKLIGSAISTSGFSLKPLKGLWKVATAKAERTDSIGLRFEHWAAKTPNHCALRYVDEQGQLQSYSYAEFNALANRWAHYFKAQGIRSGDAVGIFIENRPEALAAVLATVKLGAVASMLNTSQRGDLLLHSLNLVEPKLLLVGEELVSAIDELGKDLPEKLHQQRLFVAKSTNSIAPQGYRDLQQETTTSSTANLPETQDIQLKQAAYYIFTSGTTGLPKASKMSHLRWAKAAAGFGIAAMRLQADDLFYVCLPLYHNNALTVSWGSILSVGCTMALSRKFSASGFWDEIETHQATAFCYIGELCRYLLNQKPQASDGDNSVQKVIGNGLRPEIWDDFKARFNIPEVYEFYGASEGNIGFVNSFNIDRTAGFCPLSFSVVEYDIDRDEPVRDNEGHLIKVGKGGVGLLVGEVTDRAPYEGYTDAAASEKKLFRNAFKTGDCYFNTGDLVRNQGWNHIAFVDRLGDTFRWKGENVATTEIEGVLGNFNNVDQAVVYGVEVPGCDGRAGMAALTLNDASTGLDFKALKQHLAAQLPHYALPLFLRLKPEQEVTGTFKFRKVDLKKEAFDPSQTSDPLFVLLPGKNAYQPLTDALFGKIQQQDYRF